MSALDAARPRRRRGAVGEVFRGRAGGCRSRCSCCSTAMRAKPLQTIGPWIALAVALVVMAPHLFWLVRQRFSSLCLCERAPRRRAGCSITSCIRSSSPSAKLVFLLPSLLIAAALVWPRRKADEARGGCRRRSRCLRSADRDAARVRPGGGDHWRLSALSGRGAIAMWGYPLWLFLGAVDRALGDARRSTPARLAAHRGDLWARSFRAVCGRLRRQLFGAGRRSITVTARCSIPAIGSPTSSRGAFAPPPAGRSPM